MNSKIKISFWISTAICVIGIALGFVTPLVNYQLVSGLLTLGGILSAYLEYWYSNSEKFFVYTNQLIQKIKNPKSDWEQSIDIHIVNDDLSDDFLDNYTDELVKNLKEQNVDIVRTDSHHDTFSSFIISSPGARMGTITLSQLDDDNYKIFISYSGAYSFNQRKKGIDEMQAFYTTAIEPINVGGSRSDHLIEIKLYFEHGNPFYGYSVKKILPTKATDFLLKFKSDSQVSVAATSKYLSLTAATFDQLKAALSKMVIVSNLV